MNRQEFMNLVNVLSLILVHESLMDPVVHGINV